MNSFDQNTLTAIKAKNDLSKQLLLNRGITEADIAAAEASASAIKAPSMEMADDAIQSGDQFVIPADLTVAKLKEFETKNYFVDNNGKVRVATGYALTNQNGSTRTFYLTSLFKTVNSPGGKINRTNIPSDLKSKLTDLTTVKTQEDQLSIFVSYIAGKTLKCEVNKYIDTRKKKTVSGDFAETGLITLTVQ